ncbi:helix-turn-helix domain-containing protein [Corynebacterium flavescens]|uniref:helix-turn-helix domain-containing protein n=1 Tax=Corynebacterium flavescens TaxID=28028 RepID=UPI003FD538A5
MTTQKKRLKEHAKELIKAQRSLVEDLIAQRKASHLSQQEVADRMGVSQSAVSLFEHYDSNPTLSSIRRYALAVEADLVLQVKPRRSYTAETILPVGNMTQIQAPLDNRPIPWDQTEKKTHEPA